MKNTTFLCIIDKKVVAFFTFIPLKTQKNLLKLRANYCIMNTVVGMTQSGMT